MLPEPLLAPTHRVLIPVALRADRVDLVVESGVAVDHRLFNASRLIFSHLATGDALDIVLLRPIRHDHWCQTV